MIRIQEFEWDDTNEQHILQRHDVTRIEVEEAFFEEPYFRKGRDKTKYCYGQTADGRYLFVVYLYKGKGKIRVITARDMTEGEKRIYKKR